MGEFTHMDEAPKVRIEISADVCYALLPKAKHGALRAY
jgi:hypothetical protein